jgi:hypothetical protein
MDQHCQCGGACGGDVTHEERSMPTRTRTAGTCAKGVPHDAMRYAHTLGLRGAHTRGSAANGFIRAQSS